MQFFAWLESTAFSTWTRESQIGFPAILVMHALGMGFLVGVNVLFALRAIGFVPLVRPALLLRFAPVMWAALFASLVSGVLFLVAYPAKALTNPLFYVKLAFIFLAFATLQRLRSRMNVNDDPERSSRLLGAALLLFWIAAVTSGRLLAYTHRVMLAS
jgi:hypothetical protein